MFKNIKLQDISKQISNSNLQNISKQNKASLLQTIIVKTRSLLLAGGLTTLNITTYKIVYANLYNFLYELIHNLYRFLYSWGRFSYITFYANL